MKPVDIEVKKKKDLERERGEERLLGQMCLNDGGMRSDIFEE